VPIACTLLLTFIVPGGAQAPNEDWRTIRTEHFRVTFPVELETIGRKAADRAEWAWMQLSEHFIEPPDGVIDLLVSDHTDISNGFAQVTPSNRITVFARPPVDALGLGHLDEWLELVITHELAHIVHLDEVTNPVGVAARSVFGRVTSDWPFFPELGTPRWVTEGLATWYESRLTEAGRVRGTFHEMQIRTAVLEGRFEDIGQASGESPLWPAGNRSYAYGSLFFDFLLDRYGEDRMAAFVEAIAGQWVPYRIDAAGRSAFGVSLTHEWRAWEEGLRATLADLDQRLGQNGPVTEPERLTTGARWGLYPEASPDGRWIAHAQADGRSDTQLLLRDPESGAVRSLGRTNGVSTFAWTPDGHLLVSQYELDGPYRSYGDLWVFDVDGGQRRLTRQARLSQPGVARRVPFAVAVQEGGGTNAVVRVDLESGAVSTLVEADPEVHWAFPRPSPDGRWVAATRWEPGANHDVVILDARTGAVVSRVTSDRALDMAPAWSPDGTFLVWTSDRSGILNTLGAEVDPATGRAGTPRALTNVRTGVSYPSVDPAGRWLYVSGYHVDGWDVERVPFAPGDGTTAAPAVARFDVREAPRVRGLAEEPMEQYSAGATLGPRYWEISSSEPLVNPGGTIGGALLPRRELLGFGIGAQTSGIDLVGRHSWSAVARVRTTRAAFEGQASYSFRGLGNPILSLLASQSYSDGGQQVAGSNPDTLIILRRNRSLDAAVTVLAPTWRHDLTLTVGGGMLWEQRDLLDEGLRPARGYTLSRPARRLTTVSGSVNFNSSRSHAFQMGTARGMNAVVLGRVGYDLSLPDSLIGRTGADRSFGEVLGRLRGGIPLWGGGFARHTLALQASGGAASGPGAGPLQYRVGGASGRPEEVTGLELFGGTSLFFPVRGYETSSRFGRYAWTASGEYRFPLLLVNRGLRAWPVHLDRALGAVFFDAGNAWGPDLSPGGFQNPLRQALASVGAEVTTQFLALYDIQLLVRVGVALPLVDGNGARAYVRAGLPY
jgi:Tol biopolymer transport system component